MPSNLKKAVRIRMAKTGEGYQQALRHVRGLGGPPVPPSESLRAIAKRIIALAEARDDEYRADSRHQKVVVNMSDVIREMLEPLPPREAQLERALDALPIEILRKIEAIYYAARDRISLGDALREVPRDDHDLTVANLMGKAPLAELLLDGVHLADREQFDLDAGW